MTTRSGDVLEVFVLGVKPSIKLARTSDGRWHGFCKDIEEEGKSRHDVIVALAERMVGKTKAEEREKEIFRQYTKSINSVAAWFGSGETYEDYIRWCVGQDIKPQALEEWRRDIESITQRDMLEYFGLTDTPVEWLQEGVEVGKYVIDVYGSVHSMVEENAAYTDYCNWCVSMRKQADTKIRWLLTLKRYLGLSGDSYVRINGSDRVYGILGGT